MPHWARILETLDTDDPVKALSDLVEEDERMEKEASIFVGSILFVATVILSCYLYIFHI